MPTIRVGGAGEHHDGHAVGGRDVVEARVDADAQIHAGKQPADVPQRDRRRVVVDVRSGTPGHEPEQAFVHRLVGWSAAEKYFAPVLDHEPVDDPGERSRGQSRCSSVDWRRDEDPQPFGGDAGQERVGGVRVAAGGVPAFVVAVVDGDPSHRKRSRKTRPDAGAAPTGTARESRLEPIERSPIRRGMPAHPGEEGTRQRALEQVHAVAASPANPAGVLHACCPATRDHAAPCAVAAAHGSRSSMYGQSASRESAPDSHSTSITACGSARRQVPQKRHGQHRVADDAVRDHEDAAGLGIAPESSGMGAGSAGESDEEAEDAARLSYGA